MTVRRPCEYQPNCPGCPRFGQEELPLRAIRDLEQLSLRHQGPALELHPYPGVGHRLRSRLSARGRPGALKLGLFEAGSHRLVPIERCPVHHPAINRLIPSIEGLCNDLSIAAYDESTHRGDLRAVQFAVEPSSDSVQVGLLLRREAHQLAALDRRIGELCRALSVGTQAVWVGALPERNNSLFAQAWQQVSGAQFIEDQVGGAATFHPIDAFGQANPRLHAAVVDEIHRWVPQDASVVEYYAGVGTIGLGLLRRGHSVLFNESGEGSLRGLEAGLRAATSWSKEEAQAVLRPGRAGDWAGLYSPDDTVVVDPPRKGLDAALFRRLLDEAPRRLIYLSCGLSSLLREADELLSRPGLCLRHLSAWAYFPFTEHVETLLVADRD